MANYLVLLDMYFVLF